MSKFCNLLPVNIGDVDDGSATVEEFVKWYKLDEMTPQKLSDFFKNAYWEVNNDFPGFGTKMSEWLRAKIENTEDENDRNALQSILDYYPLPFLME